MKRTLNYTIEAPKAGQTVEHFLKDHGYSGHLITQLKQPPCAILVNGERAFTVRRLKAGECLTVQLEEAPSANIVPVFMPLAIVYEDQDLIVVDKAFDVPVHPSQGNYTNTLANGIVWHCQEQGQAIVFRAVNRLDRNTTGLLIVAKHGLSAAVLSRSMAEQKIKRLYSAIASGLTPPNGSINAPIGRAAGSTIERCVDFFKGEPALTHYRRVGYDAARDCSLLAVWLETGRTHQIRVHLKHIGHPLLGDFLYNPDYRFFNRQSLHSHKLSFCHPITGAFMEFTATQPQDWEESGFSFRP